MSKYVVFVILLTINHHILLAQLDYDNLQFHHLEQPLSQNTVSCFLQDQEGFLWIGTNNGLNRYNGITIKEYEHNLRDSTSLPSNVIYNLFEDSEDNLWVLTPTGLALYDRETDCFVTFRENLPTNTGVYTDEFGRDIFEDNKRLGLLFGGQLTYFDLKLKTFNSIPWAETLNPDTWEKSYPRSIFRDDNERIWLLAYCSLLLFDEAKQQFEQVIDGDTLSNNLFPGTEFQAMTEDKEGELWIAGLEAGLLKLTYENGKVQLINYSKQLGLGQQKVETIFVDEDNILWFSDENKGLYALEADRKQLHFYSHDPQNEHSISSISVKNFYQDNTGRIWFGNYSTGIDYINPYENKFQHFTTNQYRNSLSYDNVSSLLEGENGHIWIGTDGGGLNYYDPTNNTFQVYKNDPNDASSLSSDAILDMVHGENQSLWIGHWEGGISILDAQNRSFERLTAANSGLRNDNVMAIAHDGEHSYFIGTYGDGLHIYNNRLDNWTYFNSKTDSVFILGQIRTIHIDRKGIIWIGGPRGLIRMTFNSNQDATFKLFQNDGRENSLSDSKVTCIFQDSKDQIWIGTNNGLNKWDASHENFTIYNELMGLADNAIRGIAEDDNGNLWVTTLNGISKLSIKDDTPIFRNYTLADGIQGREFNRNAILKSEAGDLYFGGVNGFNILDQDNLNENPHVPPIALIDFKLFNKTVVPSPDAPLRKQINATDTIILRHDESVFSFEFAALNFTHPERNQYAYKLEGFDKDWYYIGNNHSATFTSIPPGSYRFRVKASNNDGFWNEDGKSVVVIVRPPWWQTKLAYFLYVLGILGLGYIIRKVVLMRITYRQKEQLLEKEREIDQLKLKFFTNISHEFRTPLTLILAPLETLKASQIKPIYKSQLELVHRNAIRLQRLINQLLDLRSIEQNGYTLSLQEADLVAFLKSIFEAFQQLAQKQEMTYVFDAQVPDLNCYFDHDILEKVVYNLLSNAFKYTPAGGVIRLTIETAKKEVEVSVTDNGMGIAKNQQSKIFDRFYRVEGQKTQKDEGTGIGLSLAKELIELHKGSIQFHSKSKEGSTFSISIPTDENVYEASDFSEQSRYVDSSKGSTPIAVETARPDEALKTKVYIVEDNKDLRDFLAQQLKQNFDVSTFKNGSEALQSAVEEIPDLIISDVMMPVMDGVSFCKAIKEDTHTCHIPLLMLTAKASEQNQLEGLEAGADAYVLKPFSYPILKAKVDSLLFNRRKIWDRLKDDNLVSPEKLVKEEKDKEFLRKLTALIHQYIDDPNFNYKVIAKELAMSQAQLYRKVSSLTGQSVNEYIKITRLKKAARLLKEQRDLSISEVAFQVGFKHSSHFSTAFKASFGSSPRQYREE